MNRIKIQIKPLISFQVASKSKKKYMPKIYLFNRISGKIMWPFICLRIVMKHFNNIL